MPECWKRGKTSVLVVQLDQERLDPLVRPAQAAQQLVGVAGPGSLAHDLGPLPALTNTASRSSARPRKSEVTGMSSAAARRSRVDRLGDVWAFSIFESIPLEIPVRSASWPTLRPISSRRPARGWR